jgi:antitoxin (DNA-binding transcriptional repressor) of toxin-antitoxin stability system
MIRLNVHEAKAHLSYYLQKLKRGETILLCRRNVPIAEIRPLPTRRKTKRQIGLAKGKFKVDRKFFEPLPSDILDSFYGRGS